MTGLDLARDALIEIACLVTDGELNILDDGVDVVIKPPPEAVDQMSDVVREMHTKSGLLAGLGQGITLDEAQDIVLSYIQQHVSEPRRVPLCGNSIATDRSFITRYTPQLDADLHSQLQWWTSPASRSWPAAGTRGPTCRCSPARSGRPPRARLHRKERPGAGATTARPALGARAGPRHRPPRRHPVVRLAAAKWPPQAPA